MPISDNRKANLASASNRHRATRSKLTVPQKTASPARVKSLDECRRRTEKQKADKHPILLSQPGCSTDDNVNMLRNGAKKKRRRPEMKGDKNSMHNGSQRSKNISKTEQRLQSITALMEGTKNKTEGCGASNPLGFTTSVAPDATSYPFLCQSCASVRYEKFWDLRLHEDWCGRVAAGMGVMCTTCFRRYRNSLVLNRHVNEAHRSCHTDVKTADGVLIGLHIAQLTETNTLNYSTVCALDFAVFPYICSSCCMVCFADAKLLRLHEDWCGRSGNITGFSCPKCRISFRTNDLLERHQQQCKESSTAKSDVKRKVKLAIDTHTQEDDLNDNSCPICSIQLCSRIEKQSHLRTVHSLDDSSSPKVEPLTMPIQYSRQFIRCSNCSRRFTLYKYLEQHQQHCFKKKEGLQDAASCQNIEPRGAAPARPSKLQQDRVIHCGDCGEKLLSRLLLAQHKRHCGNERSCLLVRLPVDQSTEQNSSSTAKKPMHKVEIVAESKVTSQSSLSKNGQVDAAGTQSNIAEQEPTSVECTEVPKAPSIAVGLQDRLTRKRAASTKSNCAAKMAKLEESAAHDFSTENCAKKGQQTCAKMQPSRCRRLGYVENEKVEITENIVSQKSPRRSLHAGSAAVVASVPAAGEHIPMETRRMKVTNKCSTDKETAKMSASRHKTGTKPVVKNENDRDSLRVVKIVDGKTVKCANCEVYFRTVPQIAGHICT